MSVNKPSVVNRRRLWTLGAGALGASTLLGGTTPADAAPSLDRQVSALIRTRGTRVRRALERVITDMGILDVPALGRRAALASDILRHLPKEADVFQLSSETPTVTVVSTGIGGGYTTTLTGTTKWVMPSRTSVGGTAVDVLRDPHFAYPGLVAGKLSYGTSFPRQYYATPEWLTGGGVGVNGFAPWLGAVEFITDQQVIEVPFLSQGATQAYRLTIDGRRVTEKMTTAGSGMTGGNGYALKIDFGTAKRRRVKLELSGSSTGTSSPFFFGGVVLDRAGLLARPAGSRFRLANFSHSVLSGDNNNVPRHDAAPSRIADILGAEQFQLGIGGTGYLNVGANASSYGNAKFSDRLADLNAVRAHIIVVADPFNDISGYTQSQIQTAATSTLQSIKAANPDAIIIAGGCYTRNGYVSTQEQAGESAVRAAAAAAGVAFVSQIDYDDLRATAPAYAAGVAYKRGDVVTNTATGGTVTHKAIIEYTSSGALATNNFETTNWATNFTYANLIGADTVHPSAAGMDYQVHWWKRAIVDVLKSYALAG